MTIDVWFVMIGKYLKIWNLRVQKYLNIKKIIFKVVQMKFLAMHITYQKLSFDIFTVGNVQNIFTEHLNILMIFGIKEKCIILTHVFLAIATNVPVLLMTFFAPGSRIYIYMGTKSATREIYCKYDYFFILSEKM